MMEILYIVVPCYNEQEMLPETEKQLCAKLQRLIDAGTVSPESRILLVNDGSKDNTWPMIREMHERNPLICGMTLSRNRGHQNALLAGLYEAEKHCDCCISIDADLQDDIEVFDEMLQKHYAGADIVYGVRSDRTSDTAFKRATAQGFYKFMKLMGVDSVYNHADYRLMSKRALQALMQFDEVNLYLRGMMPLIGYRTDTVTYARAPRLAGESKYPLKKMLKLAFDGITSFSVKPIGMITALGFVLFALGGVCTLATLILMLWIGWLWFLVSVLFMLTGLQLFAIGLVGQYVGKIYAEVKKRPRFIVEDTLIR